MTATMTVVSAHADASLVQVTVGASTDTGLRRRANEDSHLAAFPVFLVADGMGGHEAGDLASAAVIEVFRRFVGRHDVHPDEVASAVAEAHERVSEVASATTRGAGSTLTGVVCVRHGGVPRWLVLNVGDSRVYRLAAERLTQLTTDHSVAQELVDQGRLSREQMSSYEGRNVITRAIGEERSPADFWMLPVVTGERLLVCSDGLTGELSDGVIQAGLMMGGAPAQTAQSLVVQAVQAGGRDNVTVVVADVIGGGLSVHSEDVTGSLSGTLDGSATVEARTLRSTRRRRNGGGSM